MGVLNLGESGGPCHPFMMDWALEVLGVSFLGDFGAEPVSISAISFLPHSDVRLVCNGGLSGVSGVI